MKSLIVLALLGLGATALPALADDTQVYCKGVWDKLNTLLTDSRALPQAMETAAAPSRQGADCVLTGIRIAAPPSGEVHLRRIAWRGAGFDRFTGQGLPPERLLIRAEGVRFVPQINDKVMQYLLEEQSAPSGVDVTLSLRWEPDTREFRVELFDADFPGENTVQLRAMVEGVDLSSRNAMQMSAGSAALRNMTVEITSNGLFESYLLVGLGAGLLQGADDPARRVAELKAQAVDEIAAIPQSILPAPSQQALRTLIGDLPHPKGRLKIDMTATPGLGAARFLPLATQRGAITRSSIWPLLKGVRYDISYPR